MSTHRHTATRNPASGWSPARSTDRDHRVVLAVLLLAGLFMTAAGLVRRRRRLCPAYPFRA
jgi:hypothetical protein